MPPAPSARLEALQQLHLGVSDGGRSGHGDGGVGVTHAAGDRQRVDPGGEQLGGVGVPQVMQPQRPGVLEAGGLHRWCQ